MRNNRRNLAILFFTMVVVKNLIIAALYFRVQPFLTPIFFI